jgi:ribosome maturation factor RimP
MNTCAKILEEKVVEEVENCIEEILNNEGIELIDVEYRKEPNGRVLRILIDKEGGVNIDECGKISRQLSDILDVKDVIPFAYTLEISSPGLNRPLRKENDFKRFIGEKITLRTGDYFNDRKNFQGILIDYKEGTIYLDIEGKNFAIPHSIVKKANLIYDFSKERG